VQDALHVFRRLAARQPWQHAPDDGVVLVNVGLVVQTYRVVAKQEGTSLLKKSLVLALELRPLLLMDQQIIIRVHSPTTSRCSCEHA
jgi:hypothetical protein